MKKQKTFHRQPNSHAFHLFCFSSGDHGNKCCRPFCDLFVLGHLIRLPPSCWHRSSPREGVANLAALPEKKKKKGPFIASQWDVRWRVTVAVWWWDNPGTISHGNFANKGSGLVLQLSLNPSEATGDVMMERDEIMEKMGAKTLPPPPHVVCHGPLTPLNASFQDMCSNFASTPTFRLKSHHEWQCCRFLYTTACLRHNEGKSIE